MPYNPTTVELWQEIDRAEKETEDFVGLSDDILTRLTGRFYHQDQYSIVPDPENFGYAYVSNMLPQLAVDDPQVKVEAARVQQHRTMAMAMEDGLNAWIRSTNFSERIETVGFNLLLNRGILLHFLDEESDWKRGDVTPDVRWVDPHCFLIDPIAENIETAEWFGHWYYADIADLQGDPDAVPDVVQRLAPSGEKTEYGKSAGDEVGRKRVKVYVIWLRETNTLCTLVDQHRDDELKPREEWFGPEGGTGPYQLFDGYPVPGRVWPLSPLVAVEDQSLDLNLHARAMQRSASRRKSMMLVDSGNPDAGSKLASAEDGEVVPIKGLTGQYVQVELGGVTQQQYVYSEYVRERLDRISGLTATVQGAVGQADTATEAQIAADSVSQRVDYLKRSMWRAVEHSLTKIGWFLWHTEGIVIPVNRRDPMTGQQQEGLFFGGPVGVDDDQTTWDDFDLRIRLNTLQQQASAKQNVLAFYDRFMNVVPAIPQIPYVRWMSVLRDLADTFDLPDKVDEWLIPEFFGINSQPQHLGASQVLTPQQTPQQSGQFNYGGAVTGMKSTPDQLSGNPGQLEGGQPDMSGTSSMGGTRATGVNSQGTTTGPRPRGQGLNSRQTQGRRA